MKIRTDLIAEVLALMAVAVAVVVMIICGNTGTEASTEPTHEPTTAATVEETTEPITEPTQAETIVTEPPVTLYNVPLDEELQIHIINLCEEKHIDPAIVFAMCWKESTYNHNAIGDSGNSFGLLQVQARWHYARMQRLGCTDLLDPYQNTTVAVDYLCELVNRYDGDMAKALTAYNAGHYSGTVTKYAKSVLAKAEELVVIQ